MNQAYRWLGILVLVVMVVPLCGAGQKTKKSYKKVGEIEGTVKSVNEATKSILLEREIIDQKKLQELNVWWVQQQASLRGIKNISQYQSKLLSIKNELEKRRKALKKRVTESIQLASNVIVRTSKPPLKFTADGQIVKYTPAELKKMAGPEGYPGFPADFNQITVGQNAKIILAKRTDVTTGVPELQRPVGVMVILSSPGDPR
ncbi:MAG: hypothetical protein KatS3mg105_2432 [Gemmatales bacterium]|nr:MAG: hypothetical protein KatS3mg105_2432 [Gemmatales bacterium]